MATLEVFQQSGLESGGAELTVDLYPYGSDTAAAEDVDLDEETNRKGLYTATVTGLTGWHTAHIFVNGVLIAVGDVLMAESGRCRVHDVPTEYFKNEIADAVLSRDVSFIEDVAAAHSLCTIILAGLESSRLGTTWTIKKTDGVTTYLIKTLVVDPTADPITAVE